MAIKNYHKIRKSAAFDISINSMNVFTSLAKLWIYGKNNLDIESIRDSWRFDIWRNFFTVGSFGGEDKCPGYKFILKYSYESYSDDLEIFIQKAIDSEIAENGLNANESRKTDLQGLDKVCKEYFSWLASELSSEGKVELDEVYSKLDELRLAICPDFE